MLGLALDLLGFLATAFALRSLPLFLVQSALAASIGVTALLSRTRLTAREAGWLVALGVGLVVLAASATDGAARPVGSGAGRALLLGALALAAVAVLSRRPLSGPALAAVAGLTGGAVGWRQALVLVGAVHLGATVLYQGLFGLRVAVGDALRAALLQLDVGPSYAVIAGLVGAAVLSPSRLRRVAALAALGVGVPELAEGLSRLDLAATGHVAAVLIAWLLARRLRAVA